MYNNLSIEDLNNYININLQSINEYENKIKELVTQNNTYKNQIKEKSAKSSIKKIKIAKDKGWNDTSIFISVIDVSTNNDNVINIYTSERISWKNRKQLIQIIDDYIKQYPDIATIESHDYPLPKAITAKYDVLQIQAKKEPYN